MFQVEIDECDQTVVAEYPDLHLQNSWFCQLNGFVKLSSNVGILDPLGEEASM